MSAGHKQPEHAQPSAVPQPAGVTEVQACAWLAPVQAWLWSPSIQAATQLAVAVFINSLFTFVRPLAWRGVCFSTTMLVVASLLISQNCHIGGRLTAAASLTGPSMLGAVWAGVLASVAKTVSQPAVYTVLLCALALFGLLPTSAVRAAAPPQFMGYGILVNLLFGLTLLRGQWAGPTDRFWREVVGRLCLDVLLAAGCLVFSGLLVLPSLAGSAATRQVAQALQQLGDKLADCSVQLSKAEEEGLPDFCEAERRQYCKNLLLQELQEEDGVDFLPQLDAATRPPLRKPPSGLMRASRSLGRALSDLAGQKAAADGGVALERGSAPDRAGSKFDAPKDASGGDAAGGKRAALERGSGVGGAGGGGVLDRASAAIQGGRGAAASATSNAALRTLVQTAMLSLKSAMYEPLFLQRTRLEQHEWQEVGAALQLLITRVASLQHALDDAPGDVLAQRRIAWLFGPDVMVYVCSALSAAAGACRSLASTVHHRGALGTGGVAAWKRGEWCTLREGLVMELKAGLEGYWARMRFISQEEQARDEGGRLLMAPALEVRSLVFVCTITLGVIDASNRLQAAVTTAVYGVPRNADNNATSIPPNADDSTTSVPHNAVNGATSSAQCAAASATGARFQGVKVAFSDSGGGDGGNGAGVRAGAEACVKEAELHTGCNRWKDLARRHGGWALHLAKIMCCVEVVLHLWHLYVVRVPAVLRGGRAALSALVRKRGFQFWAKTWFAMGLVLCSVLALQNWDEIYDWGAYFAFVAIVIAWSDKVEATVSKAVLRIVGSWFGGSLAYATMTNSAVATDPFVLAPLIVVMSFCHGLLGTGQFKLAATMSLTIFNSIILCQYKGCCGGGSVHFFISQSVSLTMGAAAAMFINNVVLPWYASNTALEALSSALRQAASFVHVEYDRFYQEGRRAATRSRLLQPQAASFSALGGDDGCADGDDGCAAGGVQGGKGSASVQHARAVSVAGTPGVALADGGAAQGTHGLHGKAGGGDETVVQVDRDGESESCATASPASSLELSEEELMDTPAWHAAAVRQLHGQLLGPLIGVQAMLLRDTTLWSRGVLSMPKIVKRTLRQLFRVMDCLSALELTLAYGPVTSGTFTGSAFVTFVQPLHETWKEVVQLVEEMTAEAGAILTDVTPSRCIGASQMVQLLAQRRLELRTQYLTCRKAMHKRMLEASSPEERAAVNHPDDAVRMLGFLYAFIQVLNELTTTCRLVVADGCKDRNTRLSWIK